MPPEFAIISENKNNDLIIISIDTKKATYQGISWRTMGDFGKRKFENFLVLSRPKERIKIIYV